MAIAVTVESGRSDIRVMGLVGAAHFSSHLLQLVLPPLFPLLATQFDVNFAQLGLIVTLFYATSGLGQATAGVLVDRFGAHRLLVCGLATMGTAIVLSGLVTAYWMLLLLAVLAGIGNCVFHPADLSILSHRISAARIGRGYAVHGLMGSLGFMSSPILIGAVTMLANWRLALIVAGAIGLAVAALLQASRADLVYDKGGAARSAGKIAARPRYLDIVAAPVVLLAFAYFTLTAVAGGGVQTFAVTVLSEGYGLVLQLATLALTLYLVGSSCGMVLGGFLADRTDKHHRVAMTGVLVAAALVLVLALSHDIGFAAIPVLFLAGVASGATGPSRDVLIRRAAAGQGAGTGSVFGFVYSGLDLGSCLAPLLFGLLVDAHAARTVFFAIAIAYALAAPSVVQVQQRSAARRRVVAATS